MEIEKEIKQSKFENLLQKAIINLFFTSNFIRDRILNILKDYDIQQQHYNVLRIMKGQYPNSISPGYIKEVMIDKGVDLTRLLDKLEKKGLIKRQLCLKNRRKIDINLTKEGIDLLNELKPKFNYLYEQLSKNINENEAELLSNLMDKLRG
jgi:DNA-binding MarR family transcriptional regulator